jgi:hypothetical protein
MRRGSFRDNADLGLAWRPPALHQRRGRRPVTDLAASLRYSVTHTQPRNGADLTGCNGMLCTWSRRPTIRARVSRLPGSIAQCCYQSERSWHAPNLGLTRSCRFRLNVEQPAPELPAHFSTGTDRFTTTCGVLPMAWPPPGKQPLSTVDSLRPVYGPRYSQRDCGRFNALDGSWGQSRYPTT